MKKDIKLMDKQTVARIKQNIENFPVRLMDSRAGYLDQHEKQIQICNVFLFLIHDFAIQYVYFEYEGTPVYRNLTDKFVIFDTTKISGNFIDKNNLLYDSIIGEWSNLNHADKNVYRLATSAIIKYANYVYNSYQNIAQYIKDSESGKPCFPYEYRQKTQPKFKDKMAYNPAFLINLRAQLELVR